MDSYFIIGDIHGEIRLLDKLLKEIEPYSPQKLFFIGDYIDRGPHSRMVIDRLMNLKTDSVFLMGNHELMLLNAIENMAYGYSPIELWYYNGAEATLQSFGSNSFFSFQSDLKGKYLDFFRKLHLNHVLSIRDDLKILITHAGVSPAIPLSDQIEMKNYIDLHNFILRKHLEPGSTFIWVREEFFYSLPGLWNNYTVVHGHTPVNKLHRFANTYPENDWIFFDGDIAIRKNAENGRPVSIDIDSGSTISGRLSGLGLIIHKDQTEMIGITVSKDGIIKRNLGTI